MAIATIDTEIEKPFAIHDLPQLLSAISMFSEPEIALKDQLLEMREGSAKMKYVYSSPNTVIDAPLKGVDIDDPDVEFHLTNDILSKTLKAVSIINAPHVAIRGDGEKVYLEAFDCADASVSTYSTEVGETDKTFRVIFACQNIKMLPDDYNVRVTRKGLSHFKGGDIEYWIALEATSTFED